MPMIRAYPRKGRYPQVSQIVPSRFLPPFARRAPVVVAAALPAALMGSLPPRPAAAPALANVPYDSLPLGLIYGTEP